MSEKITNAFHSAVGGAKEGLGKTVGSDQMAAEGASQKAQADARANANSAQQQAHGFGDNIAGRTKATVGAATGDRSTEARGHAQQASGNIRNAVN
ncbi:hypothetical protein EDD11_001302 [Mortierella claussenii]|nr:hypothetical protein EDD11_001302 [Mortierella claussenii]